MFSGMPTVSASSTTSVTERNETITVSPEGIGDIVMAGEASGYAHLAARAVPTVGQLTTAARRATALLAQPELWPRQYGQWQRPPRPVRQRVPGRMRMSVVALAPNGFVTLPAARPTAPVHGDVLLVVHGRMHAVIIGSDGRLLAVQELVAGRTRVLGGVDGRQLVNTGSEPAVVVRVTA